VPRDLFFFVMQKLPSPWRPLIAFTLATLVAACASSGSLSMLATIAGGEKIAVPLGPRGVEPSKKDDIQIEFSGCALNREKKLVYGFEFSDARGRALRHVRVEDVSDDAPVLLLDDAQPALERNRWRGTSRLFEPEDPALAWVATITNSLRVFRFTITQADGREIVLHQGAMYPNGMKSGIRQAWGQNY